MILRLFLPLIGALAFVAAGASAATVGYWRFEGSPSFTADAGPHALTLSPQGTAPAPYALPAYGLGSAPGAFFDRSLPQTSATNTTAADLGNPPSGHFSRADSAAFQITDFTIEACVHRLGESGGTQYIASQWDFTTGSRRSWGLGVAGTSPPSGLVAGELFLVLSAAGSSSTVIGSGLTVLSGTDTYVAASVAAGDPANGIVFYRKILSATGHLESSARANPIGTVFNTSADFLIGAYNLGANRWSGLLDEVRLSNKVLPAGELLVSPPGFPQATAPLFAPAAGTFLQSVTVMLSSATPGASIRYTLDGSPPTVTSPLYTTPFTLVASTTVSARAFAAGLADSALASATYLFTNLPYVGTVKPPRARDIVNSNWSVGGETVDRDYTVFANYRDWLGPLGAKRIRQQAGWAKCEKQVGVYSWAWLDECVDGALAQGVQPWLETNYGNPIYPGGGGSGLGAGLPVSATALAAWDAWVAALVDRYKDRVNEWEVWNEPDNSGGQVTSEAYAAFYIRTAEIIRARQPGARLYALAVTYPSSGPSSYVGRFFATLQTAGKLHLVSAVTAHAYPQNPDTSQSGFVAMRSWVNTTYYPAPSPGIEVRQGESGAPSRFQTDFALANYGWTELTQAKWNARRLLGDLGHDLPSSIFAIIDMLYYGTVWNYKGLLAAAADKSVDHPKEAYFAMQNIFSIFDDSLTRIPDFTSTASTAAARRVFGYRKSGTGKTVATVWLSGAVPSNSNALTLVTLTIGPADFTDPVWVDIRDGSIRSIPPTQWSRNGDTYTFNLVPLYDSPVLIADRSAIPLATPLDEWKRDYFPVPQHDDATVTGFTADPDRDGIPNLLEYALGGDPGQSDAAVLPVLALVPSTSTLTLTFLRSRPDLIYIVEATSDLTAPIWEILATNPGTLGQLVTVPDSVTTPPTRARFLRLRVTNL